MAAQQKEAEMFDTFTKVLQLYRPHEVMLAFNGGKDCTVLLHMLHKFYKNHALEHIKLPVLYIESEHHFPEIKRFVDECNDFYDIDLIKCKGECAKTALKQVLAEMPQIKAVFMGSRRSDPKCKDAVLMQPTDPDWPPLMRIYPLLDWTYNDVWLHIFMFKVPFCLLYEFGYTSIGNRLDTIPNPYLRRGAGCSEDYYPAYMLGHSSLERAGRV